jgi:hypothetical protein
MAEILRTWCCQNARCGEQFDAWEANPSCPTCGGVRVGWVPGGGHVASSATKSADSELRTLMENFSMTNINSARRDERAKPKVDTPPPATGPATMFAPGFAAPVSPHGAQCLPSSVPVNFKARVATGRALAHSRSVPGVHTNTRIEARHTGRAT